MQYYFYASCPNCHKIYKTSETEKISEYKVVLDNDITANPYSNEWKSSSVTIGKNENISLVQGVI